MCMSGMVACMRVVDVCVFKYCVVCLLCMKVRGLTMRLVVYLKTTSGRA